MPVEIPDRIAYLKPVLNALDKLDPEELGDENPDAMGIVEVAIRKRTDNLQTEPPEDLIR